MNRTHLKRQDHYLMV